VIVDYSTARPAMTQLKDAGVTAVGRYLGWDGMPGYQDTGKNLSGAEAKELLAAGMAIFLSFEYAADAAAQGETQGRADGTLAMSQLTALGAPPTMCVYFAVDYDIPDYDPGLEDTAANALAKLGPVGLYFQAINALKLPYEIGVYGGYYAVKRVLDAGLATKSWQTVAWSGGQMDPRVVLYQTAATPPFPGADADVRENGITVEDFGQWPRPGDPPPVTVTPDTPVKAVATENTKETSMLHISVTAPKGADWVGTRTFLVWSTGQAPVWIPDEQSEKAIAAVIPAADVTWAMYEALGGK
jgi:Domain of unknown function (DUF1906)